MASLKMRFQNLLLVCLFVTANPKLLNSSVERSDSPVNHPGIGGTSETGLRIDQEIPDSYDLVAENGLFQLYVDKATLAFQVVDKRAGYAWQSNLDEVVDGDRLNTTWKAFAQSGISIDYLDQEALASRASITTSDHSIEIKEIDQGLEATLKFTEAVITLSVILTLEADGVSVEVPFDSIKEESPDYKLGTLHLYPFFGATRADSLPGYMFIPDGSGSLIRFGAETKATNMFYGRYYGEDLGMMTKFGYNPYIVRPYELSVPVIGMVHEDTQNAYICVLEKGASYAEIRAHPSGVITNFNFIYNAFTFNESYFQATNRSGAGVTMVQKNTNAFDIKMHYRFLAKNDADYVGMARSYQRYLLDRGSLTKISDPNDGIGIKLEFLGGDEEKVLVWYRMLTMTTLEQMDAILSDLGIGNVEVVYYGWQPYGSTSMPPRTLRLDPKLGTVDQLQALIEKIASGGGRFFLYLDPQAAIVGDRGYSQRFDLAMSITIANLYGINRNKFNYFLNMKALDSHYSSLSQDVFAKLQAGLALDEIGSMLYSDFKKGNFMNREDAIASYQALVSRNGGNLTFYQPNDYMYKFMTAYYDIPISDSGFIYTTESVPFLEIVLAGYVPYYGPALNFSSNNQQDLLRQADYGVYPSFFLTNDPTSKILNTNSNWIYTSSYAQWKQQILDDYSWLDHLLGPVKGQEIVARQVLEDGVVATTYSNGKQIIVNYNEAPFTDGSLVVNGRDAAIRKVLP